WRPGDLATWRPGDLATWAKTYPGGAIKTVRRPPDAEGFVALARRWTVERSWSCVRPARRPGRDHERLPERSESPITWAAATLTASRPTRRPARPAERREVTPDHRTRAA